MLDIKFKRPQLKDVPALHHFFRVVITDTFMKEGIGNKLSDLEQEVEAKQKYLNDDIKSNGEKRYFLIALRGEEIIGSIEFGPASELIQEHSNGELQELVEVGTVFVHPDHQGKGIGNSLLKAMYGILQKKGVAEFCLDSGYKNAQKIWRKKFGEPDYRLKNYWDAGFDHMIWRVRLY